MGYGNNSLRIRNADGFDGALLHDGNIGEKTAGSAKNNILDDGTKVVKTKFLSGTTPPTQGSSYGYTHGLDRLKIVGVQLIIHGTSQSVSSGFKSAGGAGGAECYWSIDASNLYISTSQTNSINLLGIPWTALVTYLV